MVRNAHKRTDMAPVIRAPGIPPTPENTPAPAFDTPHVPLTVPEVLSHAEEDEKSDKA